MHFSSEAHTPVRALTRRARPRARTHEQEGVEVRHSFFRPLEWALPHRPDNACYLKVIFERGGRERALGVHLCGPSAGEVVQGFALALKAGCTARHFEQTVGIHPTCAEELVAASVTKRSGADPHKRGC